MFLLNIVIAIEVSFLFLSMFLFIHSNIYAREDSAAQLNASQTKNLFLPKMIRSVWISWIELHRISWKL